MGEVVTIIRGTAVMDTTDGGEIDSMNEAARAAVESIMGFAQVDEVEVIDE